MTAVPIERSCRFGRGSRRMHSVRVTRRPLSTSPSARTTPHGARSRLCSTRSKMSADRRTVPRVWGGAAARRRRRRSGEVWTRRDPAPGRRGASSATHPSMHSYSSRSGFKGRYNETYSSLRYHGNHFDSLHLTPPQHHIIREAIHFVGSWMPVQRPLPRSACALFHDLRRR